jgi:hypothetical protein
MSKLCITSKSEFSQNIWYPKENCASCAANTDNQRAYYELPNHRSCCPVIEKQNKHTVKILAMNFFTQKTRYESREKQPQLSQLFVEFSGPLRDLFICFFGDLLGKIEWNSVRTNRTTNQLHMLCNLLRILPVILQTEPSGPFCHHLENKNKIMTSVNMLLEKTWD